MPRTFNDSLEADIENVFLNVNEFAVTVNIKRDAFVTTGVPALVAMKSDETHDAETFGQKDEVRDYRIRASEYKIDGTVTDPTNGDQIIQTLRSGRTITCEVLPIPGMPCFEPDSQGILLLVHTKLLE